MHTPSATLPLASGRTLRLVELEQRDIYADVLEGVPCHLVNERTIEAERDAAARAHGHAPCLLRPTPTLLPNPRRETGEFEPARIPSILTRARFRSAPTPKAGAFEDVSELVVIWFQEQFGWPVAEGVLGALRTIDWDTLAKNRGHS